jgi:hypothetical protein
MKKTYTIAKNLVRAAIYLATPQPRITMDVPKC